MKQVLITAFIFSSLSLVSQVTPADAPITPKTLQGSYDKMISTSNNYQEFKVVKRVKLNAFMGEVQDSIDVIRKNLNAEIKTTQSLRAELSSLNDTIASKDGKIIKLTSERDNISTAGMNMDKESFSSAMWIALLGLLGLLIILFFRTKAVASTLRATKGSLGELENELAVVKKKALEREQELKREVQDYVNKIEAMGPPR